MAIVPVKFDGISAHALRRQRLGRLLKNGQRAGREVGRVAWATARLVPLIVTKSTGTGIAQERKRVMRPVAVLPLDIHSRPGCQIYSYRVGIGRRHLISVSHKKLRRFS